MNETIEKSRTKRSARRELLTDRYALATPGSKEWHVAWKGLAQLTGDHDRVAMDPESGEVWQYMGSVLRRRKWEHEFRHRWHPRLLRRLVLVVPASKTWRPRG